MIKQTTQWQYYVTKGNNNRCSRECLDTKTKYSSLCFNGKQKLKGHNVLFDVLIKEQNTTFNTGHMAVLDKKYIRCVCTL